MKEWLNYYRDAIDASVTSWCKKKATFFYRNPLVPPFVWVMITFILAGMLVGAVKPSLMDDVELLMGGVDLPLLTEFLAHYGFIVMCWGLCYGLLTLGQRWLDSSPVDTAMKEFGDGRWAWMIVLAIPCQVIVLALALRMWGEPLLNAVSPLRQLVWAFWVFSWRQGSGKKRRRKPVSKRSEQTLLERLTGVQPAPM